MIKFLKFIFSISVLFLIIFSLFPGNLFGYLFYGNWEKQPNIIENYFGADISHFIYYSYVSSLGFFIYLKNVNFQKLVYGMFILSVILEGFHLIIPNRRFELIDLIENILGVTVAYFVVKIYLLFKS
tara:strand:- start:160 stop:540 length:381 start_codon:yes stop_codon:yes gene_type:complete